MSEREPHAPEQRTWLGMHQFPGIAEANTDHEIRYCQRHGAMQQQRAAIPIICSITPVGIRAHPHPPPSRCAISTMVLR
jgi:hypothetical protein